MATVKLDLVDQMSGKLDTTGYYFDRIAIVTGLTGDGHSKIYAAMNATGIPIISAAHPAVAGCYLQEITPIQVTPTQVKLKLSYGPSTAGGIAFADDSIRGGAAVSQISTNKNIDDEDLLLKYTYPSGYMNDAYAGKTTPDTDQVGTVSVYRPTVTWSKQKRRTYEPHAEAVTYVGKLNSSSWRGYAAKTWLCTGIDYYSDDGGIHYNTTYSFQFSPNGAASGWTPEYVYSREDGKPPPELDSDNHKYAKEYNETNFNNISGLT